MSLFFSARVLPIMYAAHTMFCMSNTTDKFEYSGGKNAGRIAIDTRSLKQSAAVLDTYAALSVFRVAITGVWSEGCSHLRGSLSISQAVQSALSGSESKIWSMRKPRFLRKAIWR